MFREIIRFYKTNCKIFFVLYFFFMIPAYGQIFEYSDTLGNMVFSDRVPLLAQKSFQINYPFGDLPKKDKETASRQEKASKAPIEKS